MTEVAPLPADRGGTHLRGGWRRLAVAVWLAWALAALVLFVAGSAAALSEPPPVCAKLSVECDPIAWSAEDLEVLRSTGLPDGLSGAALVALGLVANLAHIGVALLIFWRKPDDWVALLLSLALLLVGAVTLSPANGVLESTHPEWRPLITATELPTFLAIFLLVYVFPDGRFAPRWTGIVLLLMPVTLLITFLTSVVPTWLMLLWLLGNAAIAVYSLVYRYRRVSNPLQRQQTKWMGFGLLAVIYSMLYWVFGLLAFPPDHPSLARVYFLLIGLPLNTLILPIFPVSVAIAIFRYRLWDIDLIIRRTLVYGVLTGLLALVYFGSVVLLQGGIRILTGQTSQLAIVLSTLAIAALFVPLRRRVQELIDRRFYRRKYDAARTLAAFGASVRDEVELDKLSYRLLSIVEETVQPDHAILWLRQEEKPREPFYR